MLPAKYPLELDHRQKQIQQMGINIQEIEKSLKNIQNQIYAFKGQVPDNYQQTEEMKNMLNSKLVQLQKEKIEQQDKVIGDVIVDVKRGRVLAIFFRFFYFFVFSFFFVLIRFNYFILIFFFCNNATFFYNFFDFLFFEGAVLFPSNI